MGTEIDFEIGGASLSWSKNSRGMDHGMLFQAKDRKRLHSDQIDYNYFTENGQDPGLMEMALCRPLKEIVPRIELLGFTLDEVEREYEKCTESWLEQCQMMAHEVEEFSEPDVMTFQEFCTFVAAHPIQTLDHSFISSFDNAESERKIQGRFDAMPEIRRIPYFPSGIDNAYSERSYFASLVNFMHPYSTLRLLAQNMSNLNTDVVWQYGPLVENGWASESEFIPDARRNQTFLIATEGSSDVHIIKHALSLLRPEIADFFRFIDVSERHPFSGTGNLVKFAEGLVKIDVHNQVVFVLDNDAEGFEAYQRISDMNLPPNMRAMMLPTLEEFRAFPARGPEGLTNTDINGRAAAIECYLDLNLHCFEPAKVVWTNYKKELDLYHGALEFKDSYTKAFLKQTAETVSAGNYSVHKLQVVLDALIAECCAVTIEVGRTGL